MQRLEVSAVVRPIHGSLGVKRLMKGWVEFVARMLEIRNAYSVLVGRKSERSYTCGYPWRDESV